MTHVLPAVSTRSQDRHAQARETWMTHDVMAPEFQGR